MRGTIWRGVLYFPWGKVDQSGGGSQRETRFWGLPGGFRFVSVVLTQDSIGVQRSSSVCLGEFLLEAGDGGFEHVNHGYGVVVGEAEGRELFT